MVKFIDTNKCPICGSTNVEYGNSKYYDEAIGYEVYCNDCEEHWEEIYDLTFAGISINDEYYAK